MSNLFPLTKVMLKNSMSSISDGKHKTSFILLMIILLPLCFIPLMMGIYYLADMLFEVMFQIEQEGFVLSLGMQITNSMTLLFSIFLIPSVYYFSKDIKVLLGLPLKPQEIIISKFIVCLLYEYLFCFGIMIPFLFAYSNYATLTVSFIFGWLFGCLTLPIYPLIISSLITMIVMRFSTLARRKDLFNVIGSLIMIATAIGINLYANNLQEGSLDLNTMLTLLMSKNNSMLSIMNYIFPAVPFLTKTMVMNDISGILIYTGIYVIAIILFIFVAKTLYIKGAISVDEASTTRKSYSSKELKDKTKKQYILKSYMKKELYVLFRTPAFFINCIVSAIIPAFLFLMLLPASSMTVVKPYINALMNQDEFIFYLIGFSLCLGLMSANFNMISATAISREGSNYVFMKYIPIPLKTQINAKVLTGIFISVLSTIITLIIVFVKLDFPWYYAIVVILISLVSIFYANYIAIFIDLKKPLLVWEQEATAVKQNMSGVITLLGGMAISFALGFCLYIIDKDYVPFLSIFLFIISLVLCVLCYKYADKVVQESFKKL